MCIFEMRTVTLHKPRIAYKLCSAPGDPPCEPMLFMSAFDPSYRLPQFMWGSSGEIARYRIGEKKKEDERGVGYYLLTNYRKARKFAGLGSDFVLLRVRVPPQEVIVGTWEGQNSIIAKEIEVLELVAT